MKTVKQIISLHGKLDEFEPIRVVNKPFMDLVIERVGIGPRGQPAISVGHYYTSASGDRMSDPEMVFEVDPEGLLDWGPIEYRQDPIRQIAVWKDGDEVLLRPRLIRQLRVFAEQWDRLLLAQGYLEAAKRSKETSGDAG